MTIDTIPYKLLIKIIETDDTSLLGVENHKKVWRKIYADFKELDPKGVQNKVFETVKQIDVLELKQMILDLSVEALKFDNSEDVIKILKTIGYGFNKNDYINELKKLSVSAKNLNIKINKYKSKLPKKTKKTNIDEVIIGYCSILGVTYDTNKITATQFYGLQKNVEAKIKATNGK